MATAMLSTMVVLLLLGFPMMVPLLMATLVGFFFFLPIGPEIMVQQMIAGIRPAALVAVKPRKGGTAAALAATTAARRARPLPACTENIPGPAAARPTNIPVEAISTTYRARPAHDRVDGRHLSRDERRPRILPERQPLLDRVMTRRPDAAAHPAGTGTDGEVAVEPIAVRRHRKPQPGGVR